MPLVDDVAALMKTAMKAKDAPRVGALRMIRAAFLNEMKKDGAETLEDEVCIGVLRRLEKQRKESVEAFAQAPRLRIQTTDGAEVLQDVQVLSIGDRRGHVAGQLGRPRQVRIAHVALPTRLHRDQRTLLR